MTSVRLGTGAVCSVHTQGQSQERGWEWVPGRGGSSDTQGTGGREGEGKERQSGEGRGEGSESSSCGRVASARLEETLAGQHCWPSCRLLGLPGRSPSARWGWTPCDSAATFGPSWAPRPQADPLPLSRPVLIRLEKKGERCAVRSQFVQPICLPEPGSTFPAGHKCQIAGWGHQDESEWGGREGPASCPPGAAARPCKPRPG